MDFVTSHLLAKELLSKPDSYITMSTENEEYVVKGIKRKTAHANADDSFCIGRCLEINVKEIL